MAGLIQLTKVNDMKQITELEDVIGKTITKALIEDDCLALHFEGEYAVFTIDRGYYDDSPVIDFMVSDDIDHTYKRYLEIITEEEYEALEREKNKRKSARKELEEYNEYQKLKAKYEN